MKWNVRVTLNPESRGIFHDTIMFVSHHNPFLANPIGVISTNLAAGLRDKMP